MSMNTPVSVVIVNYNGGPLLAECVRSVLESTVPVEVWVSDNASTDGSLIDLRLTCGADQRLRIIEHPVNLGFAKANNRALCKARHDFILFLNPDCLVQPDTLGRMLDLFERDPHTGMAGCLISNPDGSEQSGCRRSIPTPWRTFVKLVGLDRYAPQDSRFQSYLHTGQPLPEAAVPVEAISGAFMMVRRAAIEVIGPMDEGYFMHFEDLDWCLRFQRAGWKVLFEPTVEITHVGGVCSATRPVAVEYHKHWGMVRFYRKFFGDRHESIWALLLIPAICLRFVLRIIRIAFVKVGFWKDRGPRQEARLVLERLSASAPPMRKAVPRRRVLVTGATSLIGDYLLPALVNRGFEVHAVSRNPPCYGRHPDLYWHHVDITRAIPEAAGDAEVLIHLAPLATLPSLLRSLAGQGPKRVIGFGSTSVFTKARSAYEKERQLAAGLQASEQQIADLGDRYGIRWTVFRPTLVYHLGRDKNVTTIAQFLGKFGFFPLVNGGTGGRQPVHAEDLALATVDAIDNARSFGKAYNLSGGETLSYRNMVIRIAEAIGVPARLVNIPLPLLRGLISFLSLTPRFRLLNPEMANRINQDMCFDNSEAVEELGFAPRAFMREGL
jgi:GT2 family glycosyltransferase/nucleoside-diphosphate-sugar epimerase